MNFSSVKTIFRIAIATASIIVLWYLYKLGSAGFLNPTNFLAPDISAYVGGFIGGTVGLIISITTLIVLYETYFSQNKQHHDLQLSSSIELLIRMHESIIKAIENLKFDRDEAENGNSKLVRYEGEMAILYFNNSITNNFINQLNFIITSYDLLINRCKNIQHQNKNPEMIEVINEFLKTYFLSFYTKIIWVIIAEDEKDPKKPQPYEVYSKLAEDNDDARYFFKTFGKLAKKTLEYLQKEKLIPKNDWKKKAIEKFEKFI